MGCYVNPVEGTKEEWLKANGTVQGKDPFHIQWEDVPEGMLPVVLVDNGFFTAAGVGYSKNEFDAFTKVQNDHRYKEVWFVKEELLYDVSDLKSYLPVKV